MESLPQSADEFELPLSPVSEAVTLVSDAEVAPVTSDLAASEAFSMESLPQSAGEFELPLSPVSETETQIGRAHV